MKNQDGKTPLQWLLTIVISIIITGAAIALLFGGTDIISEIKGLMNI